MENITIGSSAPEFDLLAASIGQKVTLTDYRSKSSVVLFFIREFNWLQCRSHASQLGRHYPEFQAAGCEVILILGDSIDKAQRYAQVLHLPFPVLADPERDVYRHYGLDKVFHVIQRTASVIVDREGIIRYLKIANNPMSWLEESRELLHQDQIRV
jgi:thioredoxin-dependent peroxiredoxin